jgi:hypothetical protein
MVELQLISLEVVLFKDEKSLAGFSNTEQDEENEKKEEEAVMEARSAEESTRKKMSETQKDPSHARGCMLWSIPIGRNLDH